MAVVFFVTLSLALDLAGARDRLRLPAKLFQRIAARGAPLKLFDQSLAFSTLFRKNSKALP